MYRLREDVGRMRLVVVSDGMFGAVAAAVDEGGQIIATSSAGIENGVYQAIDEAETFRLTGELLPAPLWDAATVPAHESPDQ